MRFDWKPIGIVASANMLVWAVTTVAQSPPTPPDNGVLLYSLGGQTIQVDATGGGFTIPNVSAPDAFPADFTGDDYLFLTGMRVTAQGITYPYSPVPIQINAGGTFFLDPASIIEATIPAPLPESITLQTVGTEFIEVGSTRPLEVIGRLTNGSTQSLTLPTQWTTYRVSNDRIARVIPDKPINPTAMLAEGLAPGTAFITASNGGATSVKQVTILPVGGTFFTTVEGFVSQQDGSMVNGAQVYVLGSGVSPVLSGPSGNPAWPDGFFSISLVLPTTETEIVVRATKNGSVQSARSQAVAPLPDGITDAGIIVFAQCAFDSDIGTGITLDLSTFINFTGGFTFPFYGTTYSGVFWNEDGNLTFATNDVACDADPIPGYVVNVQPRISPAFVDFDPPFDDSHMFFNRLPDRLILTWMNVPLQDSGGDNTFQVVLHAGGRIDMVYNGMTADGTQVGDCLGDFDDFETQDISVAVSPGGTPTVMTANYSTGFPLSSNSTQAVFENFRPTNVFDLDGTCLVWQPNSAGGFDVQLVPLAP